MIYDAITTLSEAINHTFRHLFSGVFDNCLQHGRFLKKIYATKSGLRHSCVTLISESCARVPLPRLTSTDPLLIHAEVPGDPC